MSGRRGTTPHDRLVVTRPRATRFEPIACREYRSVADVLAGLNTASVS